MRKLKKTEDEQVIAGSEYASRLKDHYIARMQGESAMFDWARPKEAQQRKLSHADDEEQQAKPGSKMIPGSDDSEESDDPIGNLLKSNTAIFSRSEDILKNGTLKFQKLRNANAASQHQSIVSSMSFHPSENLLMTSGLDRKAKLIQIRGRNATDSSD
mmetsp:Transcript_7775/g.9366  ORF Transcript_7775/g.9366 Transcript_7775/m.9366 type:complete len:158 (+) Transcript_7775:195-668(+)